MKPRVLLTCLYSACVLGTLAAATGAESPYFIYVGSYTDAPSRSKGIYAWRFEPSSATITPLGLVAETVNPAYVCATPDGRFLYAVNWQTPEAAQGDTVSAYAIDQKTGGLTLVNRASAGGGLPNQVIVDPRAKFVMVTNYGFHGNDPDHNNSSLAALAIQADGRLGAPFYVDHHTGAPLGPRQTTGAHTHGVIFTKDDSLAFVAELGLDRVYVYHVDTAKTAVTPADPPFVNVSAGSGPRRLALSPNDRFLYVNHETDSKVSVFAIDRGTLKEIQQISTLPADFTGRNSTAEIQMDKAGRFLYVSNRGANSIAVYAVDAGKGTLILQGFVPALGQSPRNITIDPTGRYFFAANQSSNNVVIFSVYAKSGQLTPTGQQLQVDQPASVFLVKSGIASEKGQVKNEPTTRPRTQ
jgi:6-phosphogluconolactonase